LFENCQEAIDVEKELHMIGVIVDDEPTKYSKGMGMRSQNAMSKVKENETSEIETLTCLLKSLTIEVVELKQWTTETAVRNRPSSFAQGRM